MMIAAPDPLAKSRAYPESDAKYRSTKAIDFWEVVKTPHFATHAIQLRIRVTYPNGAVRTLAAAFADRIGLDSYLDRWLPTFVGKERLV